MAWVLRISGPMTGNVKEHTGTSGGNGSTGELQKLLRATSILVFTQDASLRYTWLFNPQDPAPGSTTAFIGTTDEDLFAPAYACQLTALKREVLSSGKGTRRELTLEGAGGETVFELTLEPIKDASGVVTGISGTAIDVTERRHADRKIRLLAQTVASTRDAVLIADLNGALLFANDSFLQMFGYETEEVLGKDISIVGAPAPGTPPRTAIAKATAAGGWHGESLGIRKDGTALPIDVWTSIVYDDDEAPVAMVAVGRDVSAAKQAEKAQTATFRIATAVSTAENLQDLYRAIHGIVGELMPAKNFYIAVVDEAAGLLAFPYFVDELDEPPGARPLKKGLTEYVIRTGQPLLASPEIFKDLVDRSVVEPLGAPSVDWLGVPLFAGGKALGALVVQSYSPGVRFVDEHREMLRFVSTQIAMAIDRKRNEEALRESERRYKSLYFNTPAMLHSIDSNGRLLSVSEHWLRVMGYTRQEVIGRKSTDFLTPASRAFAQEQVLPDFFRTGICTDVPYQFVTRSGKIMEVLLSAIADRDQEGNVIRSLAVLQDVTEQRKLQQQLLQAQKLESIGTLAGGIAHDFNNILGIIMGHASILPEAARDQARLSRSIAAIQKAGERGAGLVRQILTFARKTDVRFEPVNLNDIVAELGKMLEETFPRTLTIQLDMSPGLPVVEADRTQVHQTLLNLCVNARDAMQAGGVLAIRTHVTTDARVSGRPAGPYACVSVIDSGSGMDEATRHRIFEPFFTTKDLGKGTGLGLSVVYGIMESHNGFVDVESTPGKGTCFHLYFPISPGATSQEEVPAGTKKVPIGGTETLLVVEDEEMLSDLLRLTLEAAGYTVLTASNGEEGIKVYKSHAETIALVITDIGLPRMSGRDVFLRIRAIRPTARVIIASGYIEPDTKTELLGLGAIGFLQKPYLPLEIARSVREALRTTP
jgi:PAS domain S-box-containing protein